MKLKVILHLIDEMLIDIVFNVIVQYRIFKDDLEVIFFIS